MRAGNIDHCRPCPFSVSNLPDIGHSIESALPTAKAELLPDVVSIRWVLGHSSR